MLGRSPPFDRTALARTPPASSPSSPSIRSRLRSAHAHLAHADRYANLGATAPIDSPRLPPQPSSLNFDSVSRGLDSEAAKEHRAASDAAVLQTLALELARLNQESATQRDILTHLLARMPAAPSSGLASAPSASSKLTLVQALHSCLNGTPGQLPPIARHTDIGSRLLALEPGISSHAIEFRICKHILKYLAEAKYGRQKNGFQLPQLVVVSRSERLHSSVTQAPEVQLPLGDGQHLSMAIVESKSDGKDQPKSSPLQGLLDLRLRTEALAKALSFLYPGAADVSTPLLLPQALAKVVTALEAAHLELGHHHAAYASHLASVIEGGIVRYLNALTPVALKVIDHPTMVYVNSLPSCVHFDALLADLHNPDELEYQASQWATFRAPPTPPSAGPPAAPPAAPPAGSGASGAPSTGTSAPTGGRRLPQGFAATHMPIDTSREDKARFCARHLQGLRCEASKCKYSHNPMPANAFSNEALMALLKAGN